MATEAIPTWECPRCGMLNYQNQGRCIVCATLQTAAAPQPQAAPNAWECPACGMLNFPQQGLCIICGTAQPILPAPPPAPFVPLPPPEPELDLLLPAPDMEALPDLDALTAPDHPQIDRRAATHALLTHILGGDSAHAARLLAGDEPISVHDYLRRAPRLGTLLAAQKKWVKSDQHPIFIVDAARDLTDYVSATAHNGITPLEGVIVKAELYHEHGQEGASRRILYLDYEFQSPANRKRIDGVALIPVDDAFGADAMPAPGTRTIVGYRSDTVHDLL